MKKQLLSFILLLLLMTQAKGQKPVANFSASKDTICMSDCINFTDLSTNNPTSWLWSFQGGIFGTSTNQNPENCYIDSGGYGVTLIATNAMGSDTINRTNFITVKPTPPYPTITQQNDTLFCSTDPSYVSYQWYLDTTAIPGATDTFLVPIQNGDYNVVVCNSEGCCIAVGNIGCLACGVRIFHDDNTIFVSPNPAANQLTIQTSFHTDEAAMVSIINVLGQDASPPAPLLRRGESATIDVSALPAGMYFVAVTVEKGRWVGRFVKE